MAEISTRILQQLWNTTEESTWDSLLFNLDEIHERDIITTNQWEDIHYALKKLAEINTDFPSSVGELSELLERYT